MKKYAWTMAELAITLIILMMLSGICVSILKPRVQKMRFFTYAATTNLLAANSEIIRKYHHLNVTDDKEDDWYCLQLADIFSLSSSANCAKTSSSDTVNLRFANGITMKGIASSWANPYENSRFQFKNILIDTNGADGPNKIWNDQFPMRIIGGNGYGKQGLVIPVNCGSDKVYNKNASTPGDVNVANVAKNTYCSSSTKDYASDKEILMFDIHRAENKNKNSKAFSVATGLSFKEADCMSSGGINGFYSQAVCATAGYRIHRSCATKKNCAICTANNCPKDENGTVTDSNSCLTLAQTANPSNLQCQFVPHKPSMGVSYIFRVILGDFDLFD